MVAVFSSVEGLQRGQNLMGFDEQVQQSMPGDGLGQLSFTQRKSACKKGPTSASNRDLP